MAQKKQYGPATQYEKKLDVVMAKLDIQEYNYNFDRFGCYVEFRYNGDLYRFEHSIEKAKERGINLAYGSDAFAQVVLALEDLKRMIERGIYDLSTWVAGMKYLPPPVEVPIYFTQLGFLEIPSGPDEVRERYRQLAKEKHPDVGGSTEEFKKLKNTAEKASHYFDKE